MKDATTTNGGDKRKFCERLEDEMKRRGLKPVDLAKHAGASRDEVEKWLDGRSYPTKVQIRRCFGQTNPVEFWLPPPDQRALREMEHVGVIGLKLLAAGHVKAPPASYGEALGRAMDEAGHALGDVAAVLDVTEADVSRWESNEAAPSEAQQAAILVLLPDMASAPRPQVRADQRPPIVRVKAGAPPATQAKPAAPAPAPPKPVDPPPAPAEEPPRPANPLAALDRLASVLEEAGQKIEELDIKTDATGARTVRLVAGGVTIAEGRGATMTTAATAALASMRARAEARLEAAKRITDSAVRREEQVAAALAIIDAAIRG